MIRKYDKYSIQQLIKMAERWCNKYIRERDQNQPCVSCMQYRKLEAGHFYSAGHYSALRFDENNIHGQCSQCNRHLHGNLNEYRRNIVLRIGNGGLSTLDDKVDLYRVVGFKWDRIELIEVIEYYKNKLK